MQFIELDEREQIALIGLNRPEKKNALDLKMADELRQVLEDVQKRGPKILIVHSLVEGVFVSGADIAELYERDADSALQAINLGLFEKLQKYRWPTIAAIDGYALGGGCELALACDFRLSSPSSKFGQPELSLGIIAGAGGNWRLPQLVGISMARQMLYAGRMLNADEALQAGLVDEIHEPKALLEASIGLASKISKRSFRALELTKLALASSDRSTSNLDVIAQALLFESEDKRSRMSSFLNRAKH